MPKQLDLSGLERERNPKIERAASDYVDARDARMACMKPERERKTKLKAVMEEERVRKYRLDDGAIAEIVVTEEKVRVRKAKPEKKRGRKKRGADVE